MKKRVGILISGRGSNMMSLIAAPSCTTGQRYAAINYSGTLRRSC